MSIVNSGSERRYVNLTDHFAHDKQLDVLMTQDMAEQAATNFEAFKAAGGNTSGIEVITSLAEAEAVTV